MHSHSSISTESKMIPITYALTPEQCRQARPSSDQEGHFAYLPIYGLWGKNSMFSIHFRLGFQATTKISRGKDMNSNMYDCKERGLVNVWHFSSYIGRTNLTYNTETKIVQDHLGQVLPCTLDNGGCSSTFLGKFAYFWDTERACNLQALGTVIPDHVKWNNRYFLINEPKNLTVNPAEGNNIHNTNFKIEIFPSTTNWCNPINSQDYDFENLELHPTNHPHLLVHQQSGGFNMKTGEKQDDFFVPLKEYLPKFPTSTQTRIINLFEEAKKNVLSGTYNLTIDQFTKDAMLKFINNKITYNTPKDNRRFIDLALHESVKLDYIIHQNQQLARLNYVDIMQKLCELERTTLLTVLQLARINPANAGYILTGNHSKFVEADGALAWLYTCKKEIAPVKRTEKCYNKIPVWHGGMVRFVDPITRKLVDDLLVDEIPCDKAKDNIFHLDQDNPDSFYTLTPFPNAQPAPKKFSPNLISNPNPFHSYESSSAGLYNQKDVIRLIHKMTTGERQGGILKELTKNLQISKTGEQIIEGRNYWNEKVTRHVYIDNLISPAYWKKGFLSTFGIVTYYMEKLAIFYAFFLLLQSLLACTGAAIRTWEIRRLTQNGVQVPSVLFQGFFNILNFHSLMRYLNTQMGPLNNQDQKSTDHNTNDQKPHNNTPPSAPTPHIYDNPNHTTCPPTTLPFVPNSNYNTLQPQLPPDYSELRIPVIPKARPQTLQISTETPRTKTSKSHSKNSTSSTSTANPPTTSSNPSTLLTTQPVQLTTFNLRAPENTQDSINQLTHNQIKDKNTNQRQ